MIPRPGTHSLDEITEEAAVILNLVPNLSGLVGAEVGTLRGKTASILLARRPGLCLTCVDNFDLRGIVEDSPEDVLAAWERNMAVFGDRVELVDLPSLEAAAGAWVPQDFVYLDAAHDRESTVADIRAWWPHVRPGGLLMGHDYGRAKPAHIPGEPWAVAAAVHEFLVDEGLHLHHLERSTWAVLKQKET